MQQEAEARLGFLQPRYAEAELKDDQDWLDVHMKFQRELLLKNGYNANQDNLFALRQAAINHPEIAFWSRMVDQRVKPSNIIIGSSIESIEVYDFNKKKCFLDTSKLVVIASSLS